MALTACGGSSSGTAKTTPTPEPQPQSPLGKYAADFQVLQDLADSGADVYKMLDSNGWSILNFMNIEAVQNLKKAYDGTMNGAGQDMLTAQQREKYLELITEVRRLAQGGYISKITGDLKDLHGIQLTNTAIDTAVDTVATTNYISSGNGNDEFDQENLLKKVIEKYNPPLVGSNLSWNSINIRDLKIVKDSLENNDKTDDDVFEKTLIGWINPAKGRPAAQLSFYHGHDGPRSIGVDFVHMKDVSFFLYYYANTSGVPIDGTAKLMGTPSLGKDEFMKALNNDDNTGWQIAGIVDGNQPSGENQFQQFEDPSVAEDLTYKGLMLAATKTYDGGDVNGLATYMGDAEIVLDFGEDTDPNFPYDGNFDIDVTFRNIMPMADYLAGKTNDKEIRFGNANFDANYQIFGENFNTPDSRFLRGQFYGSGTGTVNKEGHYKGRDAVGGTFVSRLWDKANSAVKTRGAVYYGVFGANATP